jgi:peptidoglycan/xylan/chitin deacetylase (PgdA/CDA1 family)
MLIESPPALYRALFRGATWRLDNKEKKVYLTFDDGPVPEITPWVLDTLDAYGIKATFFCVGDNVRKHPEVFSMLRERGHVVGNHTYHHLQGLKVRKETYIRDVDLAARLIDSNLFRPPHGHIRLTQFYELRKRYKIILWDVVTRDYSHLKSAEQVLDIIRRYTRNGSIIVFHDSQKSGEKLKKTLPRAIEWLKKEGYEFGVIE